MSGLDKLNKLNSGYKYKDPYTKIEGPAKPKAKEPVEAKAPEGKGILHSHLYALILELKREQDRFRMDVLTLLQVMSEDTELLTTKAARKAFSDFRADKLHLLQRISDKKEAILKNEFNFNDLNNDEADV